MPVLAESFLYACVAIIGVPIIIFAIQILASLPRLGASRSEKRTRPTVAVVVPAHNEGASIRPTLDALNRQLLAGDRLVVVADNCTDNTVTVAAGAGAEVIGRTDTRRVGKGYALDFGVRWLERTGARDVVVFIDADCVAGPGTIETIARESAVRRRPVQSAYLMTIRPDAPPMHRIAAFAWIVKTLARPLGGRRLGFPCQLSGTGMALPWDLAVGAGLANGHLTEDLKLGMDLALLGAPPFFCPDVAVTSTFPVTEAARRAQQTRWEHGHLALIQAYAPTLLMKALTRRSSSLFVMALDLCVPPLVSLCIATGVTVLVTGMCAWLAELDGPFYGACIVALVLGFALTLAILRWGRQLVGWKEALAVPRFIVGKLGILVRFANGRQATWVRTERAPLPGPES